MMFKGTFSTDLYKALASAIHLEVRRPAERSAIEHAWAELGSLVS